MGAKKKSMESMSGSRVDLVLEGGGVKGIGLVGALAALEEYGFQPQNIAGTSVGAIVGALLAAGYDARELRDIMIDQLDFRNFKDLGLEASLPLVGKPVNLLFSLGIYEGKAIEKMLAKLLAAKGVKTFGDLLYEGKDAGADAIYRYKLQVVVSDLSLRRMLVLPRDAALLSIQPDALNVARAVRMSMSVPIFFEPVTVTDADGMEHVLVDGGLLSNYPMQLFDTPGIPAWPTFGLHLVNAFEVTGLTDRTPPLQDASALTTALLRSFVLALGVTALEAHDLQYIQDHNFRRTIPIPTLGIGLLDFGIPYERKLELYQSGYDAAMEFLQTWDFLGYIAEYRTGKEHSRRQELVLKTQQAAEAARVAGEIELPS
jgi:NTE family protein